MAAQTKAEIEAENAELKSKLESAGAAVEPTDDKRTVVQRILAIANEVGVVAPEKTGGVPFKFRGVDQVVAALTPHLNKHGVFIAPVGATQLLSQQPAAGKTLTKADLTVQYRAYGADGDFIDFEVPGQADDFADRSTAQAMSVAFRILLLQVFHIAAFGNEEEASQGTMNTRDTAAQSKVDKARTSAASAPAGAVDPAVQMRNAIVAAAGKKGWDGDAINKFAASLDLGDDWFNDPDKLNTLLTKINGG